MPDIKIYRLGTELPENDAPKNTDKADDNENIFSTSIVKEGEINLDDFYYNAFHAVADGKYDEITAEIGKSIAKEAGITDANGNYSQEELDNVVQLLYANNKDQFNLYSTIKNVPLDKNMSSSEILETLVRMACDGLISDDIIDVFSGSSTNPFEDTDTDINPDDEIVPVPDEDDKVDDAEKTEEIVPVPDEDDKVDDAEKTEEVVPVPDEDDKVDDAEKTEEVVPVPDEDEDSERQSTEFIIETIDIYNASKGTSSTIDMNNFYYLGGSYTYEQAKANLQSKIMSTYSISASDPKKDQKLEQAYDDIIAKNDSIQLRSGDTKLDAILRVGNDGLNNDIIKVTQHPKDEVTSDTAITKKYDKNTGKLVSEETGSEYREYSTDSSGNKVATVYPKVNGKISSIPSKTVTYDSKDRAIKEETSDSVTTFEYRSDDAKNCSHSYTYKKDAAGNVAAEPYKTSEFDEQGRPTHELTQIDANTTERRDYYYSLVSVDLFEGIENGDCLVTLTSKNGNTTKTTVTSYNSDNQVNFVKVISENSQAGTRLTDITNYNLNARKQTIEESDGTKIIKFDYNNDCKFDETQKIGNNTNEYTFSIDKSIDYNMQGALDCWYLAALKSLSVTEAGRNKLEKMFTINGDGTYTMHFRGIGKDITVSDKDLSDARKQYAYSMGDNTVLLYEVAMNKLLHDIKNNPQNYNTNSILQYSSLMSENIKNSKAGSSEVLLDGAQLSFFSNLFFGGASSCTSVDYLYNIDFDHTFAYVCFISDNQQSGVTVKTYVKDNNGKTFSVTGNHAYAITNVDKKNKTITIVNPWYNYEQYTFNIDDFKKYFNNPEIDYYTF